MRTFSSCDRRHIVGSLVAGLVTAGALVPLGPSLGATRLVPEEFATIQSAIDACASGDTVLVGPGTYRGPGNRGIEFGGHDVVLRSRNGAEDTVLDCEMADRGFFLNAQETAAARIEGLTVFRGYATQGFGGSGGGILCGISDVGIVDCRFVDCHARSDGGALALVVYAGIVDGCVIEGCSAERGGGIVYAIGGGEVRNCVVTGNSAIHGGGVCFESVGPNRLTGCTIAANVSSGSGGGIYAINLLYLERCIVWDNCGTLGAEEIWCAEADIRCSDVDSTGVWPGPASYDADCLFDDPAFCSPVLCGLHTDGDWSLGSTSLCLAEHSPCGQLIGALGSGCGGPTPTGACCFPDGSCRLLREAECADEQGEYQGDDTSCVPIPCQPTPVEVTTWGRVKAVFRPVRIANNGGQW